MQIITIFAIYIYWTIRGILEGSRKSYRIIKPIGIDFHLIRLIEAASVFFFVFQTLPFQVLLGHWLIAVFVYHRFFALAKYGDLLPRDSDYCLFGKCFSYKWYERFVFEILHLVFGLVILFKNGGILQ